MNMTQEAPHPEILAHLVEGLHVAIHPEWTFRLTDMVRDDHGGRKVAGGLTFEVRTKGYDSYHPERGQNYGVSHYFIVPAAIYNRRAWQRWLFDQLLKVDTHELAEGFMIGDDHPYAPNHGPGCDPYVIVEYATDEERRTRFTGEVLP